MSVVEHMTTTPNHTDSPTRLFLRGRLDRGLTSEERSALDGCIEDVVEIEGRRPFIQRGSFRDRSHFLVDGFVARYLDDKRGYRQSVGIQVPGDWIDLHAFPLKRLDHDIVPIETSRVAVVPHASLKDLTKQFPHLTRVFWFATLLDAAMIREWTFRLGRLPAEGRIAHLICEMVERLRFIGAYQGNTFSAPLTQSDFAEACGISAVHSNRSFRALRDRGFITDTETIEGMRIADEEGLRTVSEFRPDYLYGPGLLSPGTQLD